MKGVTRANDRGFEDRINVRRREDRLRERDGDAITVRFRVGGGFGVHINRLPVGGQRRRRDTRQAGDDRTGARRAQAGRQVVARASLQTTGESGGDVPEAAGIEGVQRRHRIGGTVERGLEFERAELIGDRDHGRPGRCGKTGAADGEPRRRPAVEGIANRHAGVRVGVEGDIRNGAVGPAERHPGLEVRLRLVQADTAAGAAPVTISPGFFGGIAVAAVEVQARAAHCQDVRRNGGVLNLAAVVAGRGHEGHGIPRDRGIYAVVGGFRGILGAAIAHRHDGHATDPFRIINGNIQVGAGRVRLDKKDGGLRRQCADPLDIQGDFAGPIGVRGGVVAAASLVDFDEIGTVRGGQVVLGAEGGEVVEDVWIVIRGDDRNRLPGSIADDLAVCDVVETVGLANLLGGFAERRRRRRTVG